VVRRRRTSGRAGVQAGQAGGQAGWYSRCYMLAVPATAAALQVAAASEVLGEC
jgi:hypothetical protein